MNYRISDIDENGRVWIFAANRVLSSEEQTEIQSLGNRFCENWTAHDLPLKSAFEIRDGIFLILAADESLNPLSGCGIDKSTAFIKQLETQYGLDLFNRLQIEIRYQGTVRIISKTELITLLADAKEPITTFNKTITDIRSLHHEFEQPIENAWFYKSLKPQQIVV